MRPMMLACAAALVLSGCAKADDEAFGQRVRAYLMQHPEVIREAVNELQTREDAKAAQASAAAIAKHRAALERDPRDFVANPNGKITVVEFFDYNCGYCKVIAPEVLTLIHDNPDVRVVFKDFTIGRFGPTSEYAAAAAKALNAKGVFLQAHQEFMSRKPLTDAMVDDALKRHGIAPAEIRKLEASPDQRKHLADVRALAGELGLDGTPSFVIGDIVVPGADLAGIKAAIATARAS